MKVLGIETSCDETAAAVVDGDGILADVVYSQTVHAEYGGVVPELASRAHVEKIGHVTAAALKKAGIERPDAVAATAGPGLIGALLVGLSYGKALAAGWDVPFIGVNHLEGHLLSPLLEKQEVLWPFLALLVSGGHTSLYLCKGLGDYEQLGDTVDDAAGEAFDKVARLLGLGYPGGPVVDRLAAQGDGTAIAFPRPLPGELNFSFSGLKTSVRTFLERNASFSVEDLCASFQAAVIDCLVKRTLKAARQTGCHRVAVAGGVAANSGLRKAFSEIGFPVYLPDRSRCTDNAAMIAHVGFLRLQAGQRDPLNFSVQPAWSPADLPRGR